MSRPRKTNPLAIFHPERTPYRLWFTKQIAITDTCWLWIGRRMPPPFDYGSIFQDGIYMVAHREAWELAHGDLSDDLVIDHLCRNPPCVNPSHLEPVTQSENTRRGWAHKRAVEAGLEPASVAELTRDPAAAVR